jgi:hypothetical protein
MTQMPFNNLIRFIASGAGTGNFVVGASIAGCVTPEGAFAIDGKAYAYVAKSPDGTQFEYGKGVYTYASHTLARTTIYSTSNKDQNPVAFMVPPIVDVFPAPSTQLEAGTYFPSGTRMTFQQTAAPPGWVKDTTHNDKALRVVSGAASSGGVNSFSSMFASRTSDATTLSISQIPSHAHSELYNPPGAGAAPTYYYSLGDIAAAQASATTGAQGGGGSHAHTYDMRVQYVDVIIAQKS